MTQQITRNLLTRLAKSVSGDMRHTQKLDAFAAVLGYPDQTAMMADLKRKEAQEPETPAKQKGDEPEGTKVFANVHTDDYRVDVWADITPWLRIASIKELVALAHIDYRGDYAADEIYHFLEQHGDPDAVRVADYLSTDPLMPDGDPVGFEVVAERDTILPWLSVHRPDAWAALIADEIRREEGDVGADDLEALIVRVKEDTSNAAEVSGDPLVWLLLNGSTREEVEDFLSTRAHGFGPGT